MRFSFFQVEEVNYIYRKFQCKFYQLNMDGLTRKPLRSNEIGYPEFLILHHIASYKIQKNAASKMFEVYQMFSLESLIAMNSNLWEIVPTSSTGKLKCSLYLWYLKRILKFFNETNLQAHVHFIKYVIYSPIFLQNIEQLPVKTLR